MINIQDKKIDKLDRQEFIKFIENLILNSDNYKREKASNSYVMALDSAWGTGKSYFIDLLIQDIEGLENIFVVKYNAWENDYCDNAFNPLLYDIFNAECLKFSLKTDYDKENVKNLIKSAFNVGTVFAKQLINNTIKNKTGIDIEEVLDEAVKTGEDIKKFIIRKIPNIVELNEQRENFAIFKKCLNNATEWMNDRNEKLVVIIDELDRCKPTFAIQTLELVKHIFDVSNIVFLFAVDIEQLSYSISSVYGHGFNSVGYLCRFFDYIAKMPNPNIRKYISFKSSELSEKMNNPLILEINEFMVSIVNQFSLTLRDIDTIMQCYSIMLDNFLNDYKLIDAHIVYMFYTVIKYKKPDLYYKIFIDKSLENENAINIIDKLNFAMTHTNKFLLASIRHLSDKLKFSELSGKLKSDCFSAGPIVKIEKVYEGKVFYKEVEDIDGRRFVNPEVYEGFIDKSILFNNILFSQDLLKWIKIKDCTYKEYIYKQLENYNFLNVDDNVKI